MKISKGKLSSLFIAGLVLGSLTLVDNVKADTTSADDGQAQVTAVTADTNDASATATGQNNATQPVYNALQTNEQTTVNSAATAASNPVASTGPQTSATQASANVDTQAVAVDVLTELNNLRSQNGLPKLNNVDVLNGYAQNRADMQVGRGSINHDYWSSSAMAPYNYNNKEALGSWDVASLPNDPYQIAVHFINNFYTEQKAPEGDFGHRKAMLDPYVSSVGVGVSIGNGLFVVALEYGSDATANNSYNQTDMSNYNASYSYGYANPSQYDKSSLNDEDHTTFTKVYTPNDFNVVVDVLDTTANMVDKNGNVYSSPRLSPYSQWYSDILALINGQAYFRVSKDGFVSANDVRASSYMDMTATIPQSVAVYNDNFQPTGAYTTANVPYHVDRRSINGQFLRVGYGQWILNSYGM